MLKAKVARNVSIPIAAGERHGGVHGVRQLIEQEIIDVVQPDGGRAGGLWQMHKMAAMAEAHHIQVCSTFDVASLGMKRILVVPLCE
eukprot:SAG31_NODE_25955_length_451_cov_0.698864_1_plen_87_part_00